MLNIFGDALNLLQERAAFDQSAFVAWATRKAGSDMANTDTYEPRRGIVRFQIFAIYSLLISIIYPLYLDQFASKIPDALILTAEFLVGSSVLLFFALRTFSYFSWQAILVGLPAVMSFWVARIATPVFVNLGHLDGGHFSPAFLVPYGVLSLACAAAFFWLDRSGVPDRRQSSRPVESRAAAEAISAAAPASATLPRAASPAKVAADWRNWAERTFPAAPPSQKWAAAAAAVRARELGQDVDQATKAAQSAAQAWSPKKDLPALHASAMAQQYWVKWAGGNIEGAVSQQLAALAGALRAIEEGLDQAHAEVAARATATAWALPASARSPKAAVQPAAATADPGFPAVAPGVTRGTVAGLLKRSQPKLIGTLNRRPYYAEQQVWSFSLVRQGRGENGRPLSNVVCQVEGARIVGELEDGDVVEFSAQLVPATVMTLDRLGNLSKGAEIVAQPLETGGGYRSYRMWRAATYAGAAALLIVFLIGFSGAFSNWTGMRNDFGRAMSNFGPPAAPSANLPGNVVLPPPVR